MSAGLSYIFPFHILAYVRHSSCSHGSHRLINGLQREKCSLRDSYSSIEARAEAYSVLKGTALPSTQILLLHLDLSRFESEALSQFLAPVPELAPAPAPARLPPSALSGPGKCAF